MNLSIIIPVREEEKAIRETVCRLKKELSLPNEIIVSDARSSDRTVEEAKVCADRVVVFEGSGTHTASRGRNDGARTATGDIFCFIDADVYIPNPEEFFERALSHFENPEIVGVAAGQRARKDVETWADRISFGLLNLGLRVKNNILGMGEASGKCLFVRREAYLQVDGFREDLVTREDGDFFARLSKVGRTLYDPKLMVYHGARRAHKIGWKRLWAIWMYEAYHVARYNKASSKDWAPIR